MTHFQPAPADHGNRSAARIPVAVSGLGTVEIAAWLSSPEAAGDDVLQILVHGGTYNHVYWDFP